MFGRIQKTFDQLANSRDRRARRAGAKAGGAGLKLRLRALFFQKERLGPEQKNRNQRDKYGGEEPKKYFFSGRRSSSHDIASAHGEGGGISSHRGIGMRGRETYHLAAHPQGAEVNQIVPENMAKRGKGREPHLAQRTIKNNTIGMTGRVARPEVESALVGRADERPFPENKRGGFALFQPTLKIA
jgi:hypothetical protein